MNGRTALLIIIVAISVILLAPYVGVHIFTSPGDSAEADHAPLRWHPGDDPRPLRRP